MSAEPTPLNASIRPGPLVLEASAGTGKTYAIIQLALRILLCTTDVPSRGPRHLLLITFTRAATAELQERLRSAIRAAEAIHHGRRAALPTEQWIEELLATVPLEQTTALLTRLDDLAVTTIHGFCAGVLNEFPAECGVREDLDVQDDTTQLATAVLDDVLRARTWQDPWTAALIASARWQSADLLKLIAEHPMDPNRDPVADGVAGLQQSCRLLVEGMAPHWNARRLSDVMDEVLWFDRSALSQPVVRQEHVAAIDRLMAGDPTGLTSLQVFDHASLLKDIRKQSKVERAARDRFLDYLTVMALGEANAARQRWEEALQRAVVAEVAGRLPERRMREGVITYDDQVRLVRDALRAADRGDRLREALHQRYDAVLVDEAQDTNPDQWQVVDTIFAKRPRIIVGDPKQAIYGWRGADVQAYLDARASAGPDRTMRLDHNWRSTPDLLAALEQLFTRAPAPFNVPAADMDFVPVRAAAQRAVLDDPGSSAALRWVIDTDGGTADVKRNRLCRTIVHEIRRLLTAATLGGHPLRPGDIAILVRTHHEATRYRHALQDAGIHAVSAGTGDVAITRSWRELELLVRAIAAPTHARRRRAAAATTLIGVSAAELVTWSMDPACPAAVTWEAQLVELREQADWAGTFVALTHLLGRRDVVSRLAAMPRGERHLTDLRHALSLIQDAESGLGRSPRRVAEWMRYLTTEGEAGSGRSEHRQLRLESDADAVQIRTIHVAKGLEYPVVFVPSGADEGRKRQNVDLGEALRLFYVAVTRAESRCYLAAAVDSAGVSQRTPLGYLLRPVPESDGAATFADTVDTLIAASDGAMDRVQLTSVPPLPAPPPPVLAARVDAPRPLTTWSITSYTRLIAGEYERAGATPSDIADPGEEAPSRSAHPLDLLPVGARSGLAIHTLFERIPFDADDAAIDHTVRQTLSQAGIGSHFGSSRKQELVGAVGRMVADTLRKPIAGLDFCLADVPKTAMLREWTFHLCVTREDLPAMVERFRARGGEFAEYADALAPLASRGIEGYLTGTVDLAFAYQGRWYLVDWKSNRLGADASAYSLVALRAAMGAHHYYLQQELYRMALDRYLRQRLPTWDPATMFGGAGYAFVRGGAWWWSL